MAARHPLHAEMHTLDLVTGELHAGGRAILEIVERLPGGRVPALLARVPPFVWLVGLGYGLVSRNRRAISRALRLQTVCRLPPAT